MGQYYKVVNTTKKQVMIPHSFGSGAKLMEFSSDGMSIMQGLAVLLADGNGRGGGDLNSSNSIVGSWAGDQIVVAGDYADEGNFVDGKYEYENILEFFSNRFKTKYKVLDKKEYLTIALKNALSIDPTWEDAYRLQMQAYIAKGNRPQAIKTYQKCVDVLDEEFGIDPLPETRNLLKEIESIQ